MHAPVKNITIKLNRDYCETLFRFCSAILRGELVFETDHYEYCFLVAQSFALHEKVRKKLFNRKSLYSITLTSADVLLISKLPMDSNFETLVFQTILNEAHKQTVSIPNIVESNYQLQQHVAAGTPQNRLSA